MESFSCNNAITESECFFLLFFLTDLDGRGSCKSGFVLEVNGQPLRCQDKLVNA